MHDPRHLAVDADVIGHGVYKRGKPAFDAVVAAFAPLAPGLVGADGEIDRKVLGPLVFGSRERLDVLNSIAWPAIQGGIVEELTRLATARA